MKEQDKCRSPVKSKLKKLNQVKIYGSIKTDSEIIAVLFVILHNFSSKFGPLRQALPKGPQELILFIFEIIRAWGMG